MEVSEEVVLPISIVPLSPATIDPVLLKLTSITLAVHEATYDVHVDSLTRPESPRDGIDCNGADGVVIVGTTGVIACGNDAGILLLTITEAGDKLHVLPDATRASAIQSNEVSAVTVSRV